MLQLQICKRASIVLLFLLKVIDLFAFISYQQINGNRFYHSDSVCADGLLTLYNESTFMSEDNPCYHYLRAVKS